MRTSLCDLLGIDVAIVQGPMAGGWTTPALVAEVSEAGGLGTLAGGRIPAGDLRASIEETRGRTRRPFGVNFLVPAPAPELVDDAAAQAVLARIRDRLGLATPPAPTTPGASVDEALEIALAARVPVISFAMGSPRPYAARVHAAGAIVMASVTTVAEALEVAASGADVVVAQGAEAGGHRSTFALA